MPGLTYGSTPECWTVILHRKRRIWWCPGRPKKLVIEGHAMKAFPAMQYPVGTKLTLFVRVEVDIAKE